MHFSSKSCFRHFCILRITREIAATTDQFALFSLSFSEDTVDGLEPIYLVSNALIEEDWRMLQIAKSKQRHNNCMKPSQTPSCKENIMITNRKHEKSQELYDYYRNILMQAETQKWPQECSPLNVEHTDCWQWAKTSANDKIVIFEKRTQTKFPNERRNKNCLA